MTRLIKRKLEDVSDSRLTLFVNKVLALTEATLGPLLLRNRLPHRYDDVLPVEDYFLVLLRVWRNGREEAICIIL